MTRIKAHFDGRVFIPDHPIQLPAGAEVVLDVTSRSPSGTETNGPTDQLRRAREMVFGSLEVPPLPPEAMRRESMYRDDA
ncbi:MAG: hypothetical protein WD749_05240 [Phycisphaerales bacterium]